ncbi:hypothetical protein BGZ63DRAFT_449169 [Mariannaea sp. PMI_226]|nr:hypothetical protein BGZ63DRAFT_449169 [Mariannaea sp. PMI_226]
MAQVVSLVAPSKAAANPGGSSSMDVNDHEAPRAAELADSPSPRSIGNLARKRAATINTEEASYPRFEHLRINTASSTMSIDSPRDHICLCIPAPKIPRPRNAFILFRQHQQSKVADANPALSNPEISKIIGEQWHEAPPSVKEKWKSLADEEKQRHQLRYPDYRYQPRRGARAQANRSGTTPTEDGARCPKCNGRSLATPRTGSLPTPTSTTARPGAAPYTPTTRADETEVSRRGSYPSMPPGRAQFPSQGPSFYDGDEYDTDPHEMKRRRIEGAGFHPGPSATIPSNQSMRHSIAGPPSAARIYEAHNLPTSGGGLARPRAAPMPPPPRPSVAGPWSEQSPHNGRHHSFDESLRLPPLQTSTHRSASMTAGADQQAQPPSTGLGISGSGRPQPPSDIMSIPFNKKLAVLARICHEDPLYAPAKIEPGARRSVIAVEGPKARILEQVGNAIEKAVMAIEQFDVRSWGNHSTQEITRREDIPDEDQDAVWEEARRLIKAYFKTMERWHDISEQIEEHVATKHKSTKSDDEGSSRRGSDESTSSDLSQKSTLTKTPVALLKQGYSLTLSDLFACNAPITDRYKAIDHWQWAATLWRRVIEADLVVYVKPSEEDEIATYGAVYVQKSPALMVVRIPAEGGLDEATERRVAFEVVEWIRGG